ncbi:MAG TPA: hypothetical protein VIG44_05530 [Thermomicrobiales bacterium]|jgi:hypothetical protein
MSPHADKKRGRIQEMFGLWHSLARDTAHADCLREIQEDIVVTSPKVYESGIITSLDLRLVDLYGNCAIESGDALSALVEHERIS